MKRAMWLLPRINERFWQNMLRRIRRTPLPPQHAQILQLAADLR